MPESRRPSSIDVFVHGEEEARHRANRRADEQRDRDTAALREAAERSARLAEEGQAAAEKAEAERARLAQEQQREAAQHHQTVERELAAIHDAQVEKLDLERERLQEVREMSRRATTASDDALESVGGLAAFPGLARAQVTTGMVEDERMAIASRRRKAEDALIRRYEEERRAADAVVTKTVASDRLLRAVGWEGGPLARWTLNYPPLERWTQAMQHQPGDFQFYFALHGLEIGHFDMPAHDPEKLQAAADETTAHVMDARRRYVPLFLVGPVLALWWGAFWAVLAVPAALGLMHFAEERVFPPGGYPDAGQDGVSRSRERIWLAAGSIALAWLFAKVHPGMAGGVLLLALLGAVHAWYLRQQPASLKALHQKAADQRAARDAHAEEQRLADAEQYARAMAFLTAEGIPPADVPKMLEAERDEARRAAGLPTAAEARAAHPDALVLLQERYRAKYVVQR